MLNLKPTKERIQSVIVEAIFSSVPTGRVEVTSNPDRPDVGRDGRTLDFQVVWIPVQPGEEVFHSNSSSKFIDNNALLIEIAIPPLRAGTFNVSMWASLLMGQTRFADTSRTPEDSTPPSPSIRRQMSLSDASESPIILNILSGGDKVKLVCSGQVEDVVPVDGAIALERSVSEFKTRSQNCCVVFVDIFFCRFRACELCMGGGDEGGFDRGQSNRSLEPGDQLPVGVPGSTELLLALDPVDAVREVGIPIRMGDCKDPIAALGGGHVQQAQPQSLG